jgi:hypothetical protein
LINLFQKKDGVSEEGGSDYVDGCSCRVAAGRRRHHGGPRTGPSQRALRRWGICVGADLRLPHRRNLRPPPPQHERPAGAWTPSTTAQLESFVIMRLPTLAMATIPPRSLIPLSYHGDTESSLLCHRSCLSPQLSTNPTERRTGTVTFLFLRLLHRWRRSPPSTPSLGDAAAGGDVEDEVVGDGRRRAGEGGGGLGCGAAESKERRWRADYGGAGGGTQR